MKRRLKMNVVAVLAIVACLGCEKFEASLEEDLYEGVSQGIVNGSQQTNEDIAFANHAIAYFGNEFMHGCAGVLVSPHVVLSAAHCGFVYEMSFGASGPGSTEGPLDTRDVITKIEHYQLDIGLYVLEETPVGLSPYWNPADDDRVRNHEQQPLFMYGWGGHATTLERMDCYGIEFVDQWSVAYGDCINPTTGQPAWRQPGDSGGPVFNIDGELVAVHHGPSYEPEIGQGPMVTTPSVQNWIESNLAIVESNYPLGDVGLEVGYDRPGGGYDNIIENNAEDCRDACIADIECKAFSWVASSRNCYLKDEAPGAKLNGNVVSGVVRSRSQLEFNTDRKGNGYNKISNFSDEPRECRALCDEDPRCRAFTHVLNQYGDGKNWCYLKDKTGTPTHYSRATSGVVRDTERLEYVVSRGIIADQFSGMVTSPEACQEECAKDSDCKSYTYRYPTPDGLHGHQCNVKDTVEPRYGRDLGVSGVMRKGDFEYGVDRLGGGYQYFSVNDGNPETCRAACMNDSRCKAFTLLEGTTTRLPRCYLKDIVPAPRVRSDCISGVK